MQPTCPPNPEPQVADNQQPTGSSAADNAGGIKGWGLQACLERALAKELPPHVEQSLLVLAGSEKEQREWSISGAYRSQLLWSFQYSFIGSQSSVTQKPMGGVSCYDVADTGWLPALCLVHSMWFSSSQRVVAAHAASNWKQVEESAFHAYL